MITEALQYIAGLGRASAEPKRLDIADPRAVRFYAGDGKHVAFDLPPPPRKHCVKQLDDLIAMAARFDEDPADHHPVVFYDEAAVVLVIDDEGHRVETATLTLVESDAFRVIKSLGGGTKAPSFDQKSFVRLLRIDLAGTLPASALLDIVRAVKIENGSVIDSEVRKSRESMGRSIMAAVSTEKDIPDTVTLSVPAYKTSGETDRYPVQATVECDPTALTGWRLIPFPDEIERVQAMAVGSIAGRLKAELPEGVPCYYGSK